MKMTTISSPIPPAISERVTDCWPSDALTVVLATVVISAGSAPALIRLARVVAESDVKLPVISVWLLCPPPVTTGAVRTSLSRKIAICAAGGGLVVLLEYALNAAVVIFDHSLAPAALKLMSTAIAPLVASVPTEAELTSLASRLLSIFQWYPLG